LLADEFERERTVGSARARHRTRGEHDEERE
jgi:hypothetical protein